MASWLLNRVTALLMVASCMASSVAGADSLSTNEAGAAIAAGLVKRAQVDRGAFQIVESLTPEVGARLAGSEADAWAVAWAVGKFRTQGYDEVYMEPVRLTAWRQLAESATVVAPISPHLVGMALGTSAGTD
jgi:hypothetical protein